MRKALKQSLAHSKHSVTVNYDYDNDYYYNIPGNILVLKIQ